MADDKFRRQLASALDEWVGAEWIEPAQRERIRQHYQLDSLQQSASGRFVVVMVSIGAVLVGLGIIVFIAANWDSIPPSVQALGALGVMAIFQLSGFLLWRGEVQFARIRIRQSSRLGSALLLIGEFALGASIALMAQWFQISGEPGGLFLSWGLGVLGVAIMIRHPASGILAMVLLLIGYCTYNWSWQQAVIPYLPWVVLAVLIPLAYWCASRWIAVLAGFGLVASLGNLILVFPYSSSDPYPDASYFYLSPLLGLIGSGSLWAWSLGHVWATPWLRSRLGVEQEEYLDFAPILQWLSLFTMLTVVYGLSFWWGWVFYDPLFQHAGWQRWGVVGGIIVQMGLSGITLIVFGLGSVGVWLRAWRQGRLDPNGLAVGLAGLAVLVLLHSGALWGLSLLVVNAVLFGLGAFMALQGLQQAQRWQFWLGLLTLTLQILTRFFEYDTGLLLKSLALVVCGVGVILAGLRFERSVVTRRPLPESVS